MKNHSAGFRLYGFILINLLASLISAGCGHNSAVTSPPAAAPEVTVTPVPAKIIPLPEADSATGRVFNLTSASNIYYSPSSEEINNICSYLSSKLSPSTGFPLRVISSAGIPGIGSIYLTTQDADPSLGDEGYKLTITSKLVTLQAYKPEGLFRGVQTIRQLLPPSVENNTVQPGPWQIDTRIIIDYPRFQWRGAMLDVARHFFKVQDVKRYIDLMALYKLNRLHIHLSDDQGWRLMINSWPNLAVYGGSTSVNGDGGGYYTQAEYSEIVSYAQSRYITVVPEIDMPGHVNAALASYAALNCSGIAPSLYTGINVGFSSLCVDKDTTYKFISDVIGEIASLTPGDYIHIGGDEVSTLSTSKYANFINKAQDIVSSYGKKMIGWEEVGWANLKSTSVAQYWSNINTIRVAASQGVKIIMSPSSKAYMDMKYNSSTPLGQNWAGYIDVQTAYNWNPAAMANGINDNNILGVEAPLWTETIKTMSDIEYMAFPRVIGYAEIGWTQQSKRNWDDYKARLALQGKRLEIMGVNFYKSPQVDWIMN